MTGSAGRDGLAARVAFLSDARAYGEAPVKTRETHMSWVFLTPEHAYKLKKPIRTEQIDLTAPAARKRNCREELRLNRRLAPSVYLGVVALTRQAAGGYALDGEGAAVDWLVKMRRLRADLTLENRIETGRASRADIEAVAHTLGEFYQSQPPVGVSSAAYRARFGREIARNREVFEEFPNIADPQQVARVTAGLEAFLRERSRLLGSRAGAVVDGHGDLKPEHVYLEAPPAIIDCLDFSRRLRLVDPLHDLAFLAMDCTRLGAAWIETPLLDGAGAEPARAEGRDELLAFYKAVHAFTRARLAVLHVAEGDPRTPEKWPRQTRERLGLAEALIAPATPEGR